MLVDSVSGASSAERWRSGEGQQKGEHHVYIGRSTCGALRELIGHRLFSRAGKTGFREVNRESSRATMMISREKNRCLYALVARRMKTD